MSLTPSSMLPLGTQAPDFQLPDTVTDQPLSLAALKGRVATVVMFICNHCPYVIHVQSELVKIANDYASKGIQLIGISANDAKTHPEDGPDKMKVHALAQRYPFPYLYDETQATAKAYQAECTPDFFVFDAELKLAYRGRLDGSTPGNQVALTGEDLRAALDALIAGKPVSDEQHPSMGCNIKWK